MVSIANALQELLNDFDRISINHVEINDTEVRVTLQSVIRKWLISPKQDMDFPESFAMLSDDGNREVKDAVLSFFQHTQTTTNEFLTLSPHKRLILFQLDDVQTSEDNTFQEYLGYIDLLSL